jgi:hypothetical protein
MIPFAEEAVVAVVAGVDPPTEVLVKVDLPIEVLVRVDPQTEVLVVVGAGVVLAWDEAVAEGVVVTTGMLTKSLMFLQIWISPHSPHSQLPSLNLCGFFSFCYKP